MNVQVEDEDIGQFGSEVLTKVAASITYGLLRPSTDDAAPVNGFEPEVIAQAAMLVRLSVPLTLLFQCLTPSSAGCAGLARMRLF